jgi:hypothetical protein
LPIARIGEAIVISIFHLRERAARQWVNMTDAALTTLSKICGALLKQLIL